MIAKITAKSVLNKHRKRDDWFLDDYSVNPYSGCAFGCVYCYVHGSKYGGRGSGGVAAKVNAAELLSRQLRRRAKRGEHGVIAIATATEAYQPAEEGLGLTRRLLRVILSYRFPVHIITKSELVLRDLDLLARIDERAVVPRDLKPHLERGAIVTFSFSTLDERLAKIFEPGAPAPRKRLEAMSKCSEEGFLTGAAFIPVLPYLSDSEEDLEEMIATAKEFGARYVFVGALTLFGGSPGSCRERYFKAIETHFPELIDGYARMYRGAEPPGYQRRLEAVAEKLCDRHGIGYKIAGAKRTSQGSRQRSL